MATKAEVTVALAGLRSDLSTEIGKLKDRVDANQAGAASSVDLDGFVAQVADAKASLVGQLQGIAPATTPAPTPPPNQP